LIPQGSISLGICKEINDYGVNLTEEIDEMPLGITLFPLVQSNEQIPILVVKLKLDTQ
jgi:hypothetical protein